MSDLERLKEFYPFDEQVLASVSEAAAWQNRHSFAQLADHYGIGGGPTVVPASQEHKAFEVLTIKPQQDYDATHARLYHLPMSLPIDPNMTMRALRLFAADPMQQLVLAGNPSAAGQRYGKLRLQGVKQVWNGNLTPVVDPFLSYVRQTGVTTTEELGFSYGADLAAASSARAVDHDISVEQGVWMESAAAANRGPGLIGLTRLGLDFTSAGNKLDDYVAACDSPPLNEARDLSDVGLPRYLLGLARLSNIAIENSLAHAGFEGRAAAALTAQSAMRATLVWETASELTEHGNMTAITERLSGTFGPERVGSLVMKDMHHAGGDDIDLHAAIVLQSLKSAA